VPVDGDFGDVHIAEREIDPRAIKPSAYRNAAAIAW